jgi:hypothetical protein
MRGKVLSYFEMCQTEGTSLQRGMNFRLRGRHSVILMSIRPNSPYQDRVEDDGATLIYEGHDVPKSPECPIPKSLDQAMYLPSGSLTENGKFFEAAKRYNGGGGDPDVIRVYEKMRKGIWADNGYFHLVDAWQERQPSRSVFKFKLVATELGDEDLTATSAIDASRPHSRIIPTTVKLEVWKRDGGKCQICNAEDELHFDHILPYAKGGTSLKAENVQLLCARHNLQKRDRIE